MGIEETIEKGNKFIMPTYGRFPLEFERGEGIHLYFDGKEYTDCVTGLGATSLGHSHPKVVKAVKEQAEKLFHVSNLYHIPEQYDVAELLADICPDGIDKFFFVNTGAEAVESFIKLSRKATGKKEIISADNSFHGRTIGSLSVTGQKKYQEGFGPMLPGTKLVPYNDSEALRKAINRDTAVVLLEPIQGEGGVITPKNDYLKEVREICDEKDVLLGFDEVQTGFCRTGNFFGAQTFDTEPDIMTMAKAMANGFPIGAIGCNDKANKYKPGDDARTFGGNPLACAASKATIETMISEKIYERAKEMGDYFIKKLEEETDGNPLVKEIRGYGLMIGVELNEPKSGDIVEKALDENILLVKAGDYVVRFLPPLIITKPDIDFVTEKITFQV